MVPRRRQGSAPAEDRGRAGELVPYAAVRAVHGDCDQGCGRSLLLLLRRGDRPRTPCSCGFRGWHRPRPGPFAVLSDGTKIDSPRFLRRAEKRLKRAQQALSRKEKGSNNRDKVRLRLARAHARVADARREFHHQLSTSSPPS
ncbi:transposase [Streptomyces coerulescens]|uniref:Transposase n=1 Tax=Streptomyces coerulescens TaxID=29304 RepID=A0ABW0CXJ6_STRCD